MSSHLISFSHTNLHALALPSGMEEVGRSKHVNLSNLKPGLGNNSAIARPKTLDPLYAKES
jgi:hypothetical protein